MKRNEFEKWFEKWSDESNYWYDIPNMSNWLREAQVSKDWARYAWDHQQRKIDELKLSHEADLLLREPSYEHVRRLTKDVERFKQAMTILATAETEPEALTSLGDELSDWEQMQQFARNTLKEYNNQFNFEQRQAKFLLNEIKNYASKNPISSVNLHLSDFSIEDKKVIFTHDFTSIDEEYLNDYVDDIVCEITFELRDILSELGYKRGFVYTEHDFCSFEFEKEGE